MILWLKGSKNLPQERKLTRNFKTKKRAQDQTQTRNSREKIFYPELKKGFQKNQKFKVENLKLEKFKFWKSQIKFSRIKKSQVSKNQTETQTSKIQNWKFENRFFWKNFLFPVFFEKAKSRIKKFKSRSSKFRMSNSKRGLWKGRKEKILSTQM